MIFGFVLFRLPEYLVFIDLLKVVFKVFDKNWTWYFILKQTQIKNGCFSLKNRDLILKNVCFSIKKWLFFLKNGTFPMDFPFFWKNK